MYLECVRVVGQGLLTTVDKGRYSSAIAEELQGDQFAGLMFRCLSRDLVDAMGRLDSMRSSQWIVPTYIFSDKAVVGEHIMRLLPNNLQGDIVN